MVFSRGVTQVRILSSFENLHQFFRSFDEPFRLARSHLFPIAHAVADGADTNAGIVAAVYVVGTVTDQHSSFLRNLQTFNHMQQHARLWFQPESIVATDDALEVVRAQSLQDDLGILDRLVGRHGLSCLREMPQGYFDTGIELSPVQAMSQIMPPEHP